MDMAERAGMFRTRAQGRWMNSRIEKLDRENTRLRTEVQMLRGDLGEERDVLQETLGALKHQKSVTVRKSSGLFRVIVVGGVAYLLGSKAGRQRYDQIMGKFRETRDQVRQSIEERREHPAPVNVPEAGNGVVKAAASTHDLTGT